MNPLLATPAAAAAASAARSAFSSFSGLGAAAGLGASPASSSGGSSFQQQLAVARAMTPATPAGLAGLPPAQLREKLAALSPDQQVSLAQQLVGSTVSVTDFSGHVHTGVADKLQLQNGTPTFQVGGHSYTLASLVGVSGSHVA